MTDRPEGNDLDVCCCGDYRRSHKDGVGRCMLGKLCRPVPCTKFRLYSYGPPKRDRQIEDGRYRSERP